MSQDATHFPLKTILHDSQAVEMDGLSNAQIMQQEAKLVKSKERALLLCSLLSAYYLLDVVALLKPGNASLQVLVHHKTAIDFTKHVLELDYVICHMVSRLTNLVMSWSQG